MHLRKDVQLIIAVALIVIAGLASNAAAQVNDTMPPAAWHGDSLAAVRVVGVEERLAAEIEAAVASRVGVLDVDSVHTALSVVHSRVSGGDIEARVVRGLDGKADLVLIVHPEEMVSSVEVTGVPDDFEAWKSYVLVAAGDRLIENRLLRTVYGLEEALGDVGYLDAGVALSVRPAGDKQMQVEFAVQAGERARVVAVDLEPGLPPEVDADELKLINHADEPYRRTRRREDAERIRRFLVERDYRQARVGQPEVVREDGGVRLRYPVNAGRRIDIEFTGFEVRQLRKKGRIPVLREQGFDPALIPPTSRELVDFMQSRGHYGAAVEVATEEDETINRVTFTLMPGGKSKLESLEIDGNGTFERKRLQSLMLTEPGRPLVDSELADDLDNLRSFYVRQGFAQVDIESQVTTVDADQAVHIAIEEGPRSMIGSVEVHGLEQVERDEALSYLPIRVGQPYHDSAVQEGAAELQRRYRELGYRSSLVSAEAQARDVDAQVYDIEYSVVEGHQVHVGEVFVRGLDRTEPSFLRKVLGLEPGDILSTGRMVEAESRLFQLGLFSEVDVRSSPAAPFAASEDLIVEVVEAPIHRLSYGLGWDSEDGPRGVLGYVRNNWLGRGLAWNFDTSISINEKLYRVLLTQPWIGSHRTPITYSAFLLEEDRESFQLEQAGVQVGARQQRGRTTTGLLLTWRRNEPSQGAFGLDREIAPVEITSVTPSLFVDRRDDAFDPRRGWSALVEIEQAFSLLGTEEQFTRLFTQGTRYFDLGRAGTLAGALRAGWIHPTSTAGAGPDRGLVPPELESNDVHISERFVSGGRSSHRAYARFELGERGETLLLCDDLPVDDRDCSPGEILPIGGAALGLANLDWRFPIWGGLGGVAFVDAGNVWGDWNHADEINLGAGVGFRYASPVGPLRLEIGWKLDRESFEDPYVIVISVGNPF